MVSGAKRYDTREQPGKQGLPAGCNQGIKAAEPENDILLLNNDTIVLPNSIFWLRMGLYEEERIGATGSMSNSVINGQRIEAKLAGVEEYITYGTAMNIPMENALEKKTWLVGFAMLLKRRRWMRSDFWMNGFPRGRTRM